MVADPPEVLETATNRKPRGFPASRQRCCMVRPGRFGAVMKTPGPACGDTGWPLRPHPGSPIPIPAPRGNAMALNLTQKQEVVAELAEVAGSAHSLVAAEYAGL